LINTQKFSARRIFCFPSVPIFAENPVSKVNVADFIRFFIRWRWFSLPVAVLFFVSAPCVNADPVGDFFKRVGDSVSKAFQPRPTPNPADKKTKHVARRSTSRNLNPVEASPTPLEQPANLVKEEKVTPTVTVLQASAVPAEKAKGDLPYGIPVPGHKGMVISPYSPEGNYVDVTAFTAGSAVKDPYTGKVFLVP
jgi:hypothetical protein